MQSNKHGGFVGFCSASVCFDSQLSDWAGCLSAPGEGQKENVYEK